MDPFVERDLIENLKKIAASLEGIKTELSDLNIAVREMAIVEEEGEGDAVVEFTAEDDSDDEEEAEEI